MSAIAEFFHLIASFSAKILYLCRQIDSQKLKNIGYQMLHPWDINIELDTENKEVALYRQLAAKIRYKIETGTLQEGDALPGSRELAAKLGVSRKTVTSALELLTFDGWLENRERVGFFVAPRPARSAKVESPLLKLSIDDGFPDSKLVPFEELSRAYRHFFNRAARWQMLGYSNPQGNLQFREMLARDISGSRNLAVTPEELLITRGSQQALFLVAHALFKPGDTIAVEDPTYGNALKVFSCAGLKVVPIPIDSEGIITHILPQIKELHPEIRGIYVTPRYQYPTTITLSASRRKQLAQFVQQSGWKVIEDDFGFHYQYAAKPVMPLCSMLPKEQYVYIGTFSKILAPALRMGYICASPEHTQMLADYRTLVDMHGDTIMERAMLELLQNGVIKRHIRHSTKIYHERLNYISQQIAEHLDDTVIYRRPTVGLAVWLEFPFDIAPMMRNLGIEAPVFQLPNQHSGMRIGFASLLPADIDTLISGLKEILHPTIP